MFFMAYALLCIDGHDPDERGPVDSFTRLFRRDNFIATVASSNNYMDGVN